MLNMTVCPNCGAKIQAMTANDPQHCNHCGRLIPVLPVAEVETTTLTANDAIQPAEYAKFKKPRPSASLDEQSKGWVFAVVLMVVIMIVMVIAFNSLVREKLEYDRLKSIGKYTQAVITNLTTSQSDDSTDYYVEYEYKAPVNGDTTIFRQREAVSDQAYASFHVEQKLQAIYDTSNPNIAKLTFQFAPPNLGLYGAIGGFIALLFILISLLAILVSYNAKQNLKRLSLHGQYIQATIFARWEKKDSENNQLSGFVAYAFKIPTTQGKMQVITRAEQNNGLYYRTKLGMTIKICYLLENPKICKVS